VWTGERGGPLAHKWFYTHRFKPVVEEFSERGELPTIERPAGADGDAGTSTLRFHDLRHTCVALLIAKGAQQYEVMEHLGHTNIQTTSTPTGTCSRTSASASAWPSKTPGTRVTALLGDCSRGLSAAWALGAPTPPAGTPPLTWASLWS